MKIINSINRPLIGLMFFIALISSSCEDYIDIDKYVYDKMTIDSIFASKVRILEYINGTAELLSDESLYMGDWYAEAKTDSPSGLGSDEGFQPWVDSNHPGTLLTVDAITPQNTGGINPWPKYYKGIRKANILIERIGENKELTDAERQDYTGLAYFLRAYFYYSLVRLYGPVPILPDKAFDTDESAENVSFERSTFDSCVEYICTNMEKAAELLPRDRELAYYYMPTRGAAMAVIARMKLYSASPLYNGNTYYSNWKRSDGSHFISQSNDPSRWAIAAVAFKRIIDMDKYQLHIQPKIVSSKGTGTLELPDTYDDNLKTKSFPNGAKDIDPYKSYKTLFDGTVRPDDNEELIYFNIRRNNHPDDGFYYPSKLGGNTTFSVTQDMIDAFRMADGRQYEDATEEEKSGNMVGSGMVFSDDYILSNERAKMHDNREPRFYASISFNHRIWPATSYRGSDNSRKNVNATYYRDGTARGNDNDYNRTGYTCCKWVHAEDYLQWEGDRKPKYYPMFRYAEVLLGYVEALNEMETDTYSDEATGITIHKNTVEMVKYFNQIRYRAGLPGITEAQASDYNTMADLIKQERQIEFFMENQRYYDLRRWMDAPLAYRKPITGLDVTARTAERDKFYNIRVLNTENAMKRVWSNKMYFFPISQSVLDKNAKLEQNPGW